MTQAQAVVQVKEPVPMFATLSAGPGAVVSSVLTEVMDLYRDLMKKFQEFTGKQIQMENDASIATAAASKESIIDDAKNMWTQMAGSLGNMAMTGVQVMGTARATAELTPELRAAQQHSAALKPLSNSLNEGYIHPDQEMSRVVTTAGLPEETPGVAERAREWTSGARATEGRSRIPVDTVDKEAIAQLTQNTDEQWNVARRSVDDKMRIASEREHTAVTRIQTAQQTWQMYGQFATAVVNAGSQATQGVFTAAKAKQEEAKVLDQTQQQMTQQGVSSTAQQQQANAEKMNQQIQLLKQINDSAQVRA